MSRKTTIPPSSKSVTPGTDTMDVLEKRMAAAEKDTQELVDHLTQIGFSNDQRSGFANEGEAIPPFKPSVTNDETLHKNYDELVSRVCKSESALQTLKLNMMRMQGERDLNKKEKHMITEKLSMAADAYDAEIKKLSKEIDYLQKECKNAWEAKKEADEQVRKTEIVFEEGQKSHSAVLIDLEDMQSQKQKMNRRNNELREELNRESSMRASLEESHKSLLQRIQDMESIVEAEREEVQQLSVNCNTLKRDSARATEETDMERSLRLQLQEQIIKSTTNEEIARQKVISLEEERSRLMHDVGRIGTQYTELNTQLDLMKRLVEEKKTSFEKTEKEKTALHHAMSETANQNAHIISQYESQMEGVRTDLATGQQNEELVKELQQKLKDESRQRAQFEQKCNDLQLQVKELSGKTSTLDIQLTSASKQQDKDSSHWKRQLRLLEEEKERVLKDKEGLLDEVNQAVDSMTEEKGRLESEIEECKLEMRDLENGKASLETENRRLLERINSLEDSKASQKQIEQSLQEMLEQKNKLAYDKGKLQNRVDHLQRELEELASAKTDLIQMRKTNAAMDAKLNKTQIELHDHQLTVQRLTSQVDHSHKTTDRKEKDFDLAIKARDEAVKETHRLLAHVEVLEARDRQKAHNMQHNLDDVRSDNKQLSGTLEGVMQSHTRLQQTLETLQVELGKKDALIADLNQEKLDAHHRVYQLQKENESLNSNILSMKAYETTEVTPVRKQLILCKDDNSKMASSMETLLKSNNQLQGTIESMQDELEKKSHLISQLQGAREQEQDSHKQEVRSFEERIANFKQQLMKERDKSLKKTNKEIAEVRKQLEDILSKNGELSRANSELRHKITELEYQMKDQKEKLSRHRHSLDHLTKIRHKQDEAIKNYEGISEQIKDLEKSKAYYVKKNKEQAHTIQNFVGQIAGLQAEITTLAQAQVDTTIILQEQEDQLAKEMDTIEQWKRKYKDAKKHKSELEAFRGGKEDTFLEAETESIMISSDLDETHSFYKSQLDALKMELSRARNQQSEREKENEQVKNLLEEEKQRAEKMGRRAKAMIKSSRETINRLANHAEREHNETKKQMYTLKQQLEEERESSLNASQQLRTFQDSSLRHAEELARELNYLKSQSLNYEST